MRFGNIELKLVVLNPFEQLHEACLGIFVHSIMEIEYDEDGNEESYEDRTRIILGVLLVSLEIMF